MSVLRICALYKCTYYYYYYYYTLNVCTYFGIYGKSTPRAILWYLLDVSGSSPFEFTGGDNPSLVNLFTKKKKKKRGELETDWQDKVQIVS